MPDKASAERRLLAPGLRLVAWEITRKCNLHCGHCRAAAEYVDYRDELSTEECFATVDGICEVGRPILILSGGEPLLRPDVIDIAQYASDRGLRVALGTNGTLITHELAAGLRGVPVSRVGVSIDFPDARLQDEFRGKTGAFSEAMAGIGEARRAGIEVQINSTITRENVHLIDELLGLALEVGALAFHPFMLVPTGRGKALAGAELSPDEYERVLNWVYDRQTELDERIHVKPTDAPHYMRVVAQRTRSGKGPCSETGPMNRITRGCLAGVGFCFISHVGRVQGCGYLDVEAGDLRRESFARVWEASPVFERLRNLSNLKGKCGACEFKGVCGGCRARAYEATGDYLEAEPYCIYEPASLRRSGAGA